MILYDLSKENDKPVFWLLRHAKAPHNRYDHKAVFAGSQIDNDLTEEGRKESQALAIELKRKNIVFGRFFASSMKRSVQTAEILATQLGLKKIETIDDFQEVNVGLFTNHTEEEARRCNPVDAEAFYEGDIKNWNFPGGENYREDLLKRIKSVLDQLGKLSKNGQKNIILVGHGMFNRALLFYLFPDKKELWKDRSYPHERVVKFSLTRLAD